MIDEKKLAELRAKPQLFQALRVSWGSEVTLDEIFDTIDALLKIARCAEAFQRVWRNGGIMGNVQDALNKALSALKPVEENEPEK